MAAGHWGRRSFVYDCAVLVGAPPNLSLARAGHRSGATAAALT